MNSAFIQKKELKLHHTSIIPIEGSRGCHWNKCKFCYLNIGYQYRVKSIDKICTEIEYMIKKYGIYQFQFFDNDFIGLDIQKTNLLLNSLIDIKTKHPNFKIEIIEVITKGLNSSIIKKIIDAGVKYVQIGYESPSDKLLKKINKKNSFASNLFFVKIADLYGMLLGSVNLIINLPEETTEDILEAIENLYFLRFFLKDPQFKHFILPLEVSSSSKYYPIIKKEAKWWSFSVPAYIFLKDLVDTKYHWDIFSYTKHSQNYQWHAFKGIEKFFIDNKYSYSINKNDAVYFYNEYINGRKISEIIFNQDSIDWLILYYSNDKVISLLDLFKIIKGRVAFNKINIDTLQKTIKNLKKQGLLYHSPDFSEVVTVINIPME
ncbi:MAG: radical SAM protein [Rikenellaceae bacterium]